MGERAKYKITLKTWEKSNSRPEKFKRQLCPREAAIEIENDKIVMKPGSMKWKPFDVTVSRKTDNGYIKNKKEFFSGLVFDSESDAKLFIEQNKNVLEDLRKQNVWGIAWKPTKIIKRFAPTTQTVWKKN
jgi:hypothetical protein